MENAKSKIAEAAVTMLSSFQALGEEPLRDVRYIYADGSLDRIILYFGSRLVEVAADGTDDTIDFSVRECGNEAGGEGPPEKRVQTWAKFLGKPLFWVWVMVGQGGYLDGLIISFGGMIPDVLLTVVASSIKVATVSLSQEV
jgi:hypothetical protein